MGEAEIEPLKMLDPPSLKVSLAKLLIWLAIAVTIRQDAKVNL